MIMKTTNRFRKNKIYSDMNPTSSNATFLEYLGKDDGRLCFKFRGGRQYYFESETEEFGSVVVLPFLEYMFPVTTEQFNELTKKEE